MPEATSFTALGRGNGFPFLLNKVNVSGYNYWITLGGFRKTDAGGPSQAQIDLSLANAMKIFWNLYGVTGEATSPDYGSVFSVNMDDPESDTVDFSKLPSPRDTDDREPVDRVCWALWDIRKTSQSSLSNILSISAQIVRMYNGTTRNEDNFVGYGLPELAFAIAGYPVFVLVGSYNDEDAFYGAEVAYTTLSGIPVTCLAACLAEAPTSCERDAANLTATYISESNTYTARIDSLEFYTY